MSTGQLTKFPINTILQFANEDRKGITPKLQSQVRMLADADHSLVPSELAVRKALDQVNSHAQFKSVGDGSPLFAQMAGNQGQINSLIPSGASNIWLDGTSDTVMVSGWAVSSATSSTLDYIVFNVGDACVNNSVLVIDPPLNGATILTTYGMSVQGGKNQYCAQLDYTQMSVSGTVITTVNQDDVIGKMFIKCEVPLEQNGSIYSVGDWIDKTKYTAQFSAPSHAGLVSFEYGDGMTSEFSWISASSDNIVLWTYGTPPATGTLGFSVFYDHVNWAPDLGYYMGTGSTPSIRFNLTDDSYAPSYRGSLAVDTTSYGVFHNSYNMYAAGGIWASSPIATIQKFNAKNDTVQAVTKNTLYQSKMAGKGVSSTLAGYLFGGETASAVTASVEKLTFSNDTSIATPVASLTTARFTGGTLDSGTQAIAAGGFTYAVAPITSIELLTFSNDTTTAVSSSSLTTENSYCMFSFDSTSYGYLVGGQTGYASFHKYNYAGGTVTTSSSSLALAQYAGCDVQNASYGYAIGGYSNGIPATFAQKVAFATDTASVEDYAGPQMKDAAGYGIGPTTGCPGMSV